MKFTRRRFLAALVAMGATIALPVAAAKATTAQVNTAWKSLLDDPWRFDVNEFDTILATGVKEPEKRREVFDADLGDQCTVESLIEDIEACYPLTSYFQELAATKLEQVVSELEDGSAPSSLERRRLKRLVKALDNDLQGWAAWMRLEGSAGFPRFKSEADTWLASDIEYEDLEWLPRYSGAQGSALGFFESLPVETLEALGVEIVEGDRPGSTYIAAELHSTVNEGNEAAEMLGLPVRFGIEGSNADITANPLGA